METHKQCVDLLTEKVKIMFTYYSVENPYYYLYIIKLVVLGFRRHNYSGHKCPDASTFTPVQHVIYSFLVT